MQIENTTVRGPVRRWTEFAKMLAIALLPVILAGCEHDRGAQMASWTLLDPSERHPILVSQQPANLSLRVASGSQGLTPAQRARVFDFVNHARAGDAGNSRMVIAAPGGSRNEGAAMDAADEVRQLLLKAGYSESAIAIEAYHADGGDAPLRLSYLRYVAQAPNCGEDWSENLAANYQNTAYPDFGCAQQRNLAVMVANPADLLGPRTMTPRDSTRRDVALGKYVRGEPIGSADEVTAIDKLNTN